MAKVRFYGDTAKKHCSEPHGSEQCNMVKILYEYINLLILCFGVFSKASLRISV